MPMSGVVSSRPFAGSASRFGRSGTTGRCGKLVFTWAHSLGLLFRSPARAPTERRRLRAVARVSAMRVARARVALIHRPVAVYRVAAADSATEALSRAPAAAPRAEARTEA